MKVFILEQHADRCFIGNIKAYTRKADAEQEAFLIGAKYNKMGVLCTDDYVFEITEVDLIS